jgi:hypothetical protein
MPHSRLSLRERAPFRGAKATLSRLYRFERLRAIWNNVPHARAPRQKRQLDHKNTDSLAKRWRDDEVAGKRRALPTCTSPANSPSGELARWPLPEDRLALMIQVFPRSFASQATARFPSLARPANVCVIVYGGRFWVRRKYLSSLVGGARRYESPPPRICLTAPEASEKLSGVHQSIVASA